MLIGLAGSMGAGKDTVASILVRDHGFTRLAFADAIKDMLLKLDPFVPWTGGGIRLSKLMGDIKATTVDEMKHLPEVRRMLQALGVAIRDIDPFFWVDTVYGKLANYPRVVITDVRFPNEVEWVNSLTAPVYRVVGFREGIPDLFSDHISEKALDGYPLEVIDNSGSIADLEKEVARLVETWGL